jgi:hypothetical protein
MTLRVLEGTPICEVKFILDPRKDTPEIVISGIEGLRMSLFKTAMRIARRELKRARARASQPTSFEPAESPSKIDAKKEATPAVQQATREEEQTKQFGTSSTNEQVKEGERLVRLKTALRKKQEQKAMVAAKEKADDVRAMEISTIQSLHRG